MRFLLTFALLVTASLATALVDAGTSNNTDSLLQQLGTLPTCDSKCIAASITASPCEFGDFQCLCTDTTFTTATAACMASGCTVREALVAQHWQATSCGVPTRDAGPATRRVGAVLITLIGLAVIFRFLARMTFLEGSIGWDDWTILLAFVLLIPSTTLVQLMTRHGLGKDVWNVSADDIDKIFFYFYIGEYFYFAVIVVTKISIILLYLRIFPSSISARFRNISYTIIGLLIAYWLVFTLTLALQCRPVNVIWQAWDGEHDGKCLNLEYIIYISTALNIIFDLVVILLPIPKLAKLQVRDTRKKVGVILTFLIGLFVTVCSIIRLLYLTQWGSLSNFTYHYNAIGLWSGIECDVGVFCACMPTVLGPVMYFFREKVPSLGSHTRSKEASRAESRIRRLPSSASQFEKRRREELKGSLGSRVYTLSNDGRSADDVEMVAQDPERRLRTTGPLEMARSKPGGYRHDYADQWR